MAKNPALQKRFEGSPHQVQKINAMLRATADFAEALTTPADHPDLEIINAADEFVTAEMAIQKIYGSVEEPGHSFDEETALTSKRNAALDRLLGTVATTSDGIAARALAVAACNPYGEIDVNLDPNTDTGRLMIGLFRDVFLVNGLPLTPILAGKRSEFV